MASDDSSRKRVKPATHDSADLLWQIIDAVPVGISYFDSSQRFRFANRNYVELTGLSPEDLIGKTLEEAIGAKPYQIAKPYVERALKGESVGFENTMSPLGGGTITVVVSYTPNVGLDGSILGFFALVENITDRTRAEDSLQTSEARYRALAALAPVGIFHSDAQGLVTYVNEKWCEIGGMTAEASMGDGWLAALHPEDRERITAKWNAFAKDQTAYDTEYCYQRPDGVTAYCFVQALAETDVDGNLTGYVGCVTDISEHKRAEETLRESELELQERQAQLIQAARFGGLGQWTWDISEGRIIYCPYPVKAGRAPSGCRPLIICR